MVKKQNISQIFQKLNSAERSFVLVTYKKIANKLIDIKNTQLILANIF